MSPVAALEAVMAEEITGIRCFLDLLAREQAALKAGQVDSLAELTIEKGRLIDQLTEIGSRHSASLATLGIAENKEGMLHWLRQHPSPRLQQSWEQLQDLAREAREQNEVNGQYIALLSRNNRQLFDAITGRQGKGTFYGPDGLTAGGSTFRISDSV